MLSEAVTAAGKGSDAVGEVSRRYALVLVAIYNGGDFAGRYVPLWRGLSDRVVPSRVALLTLSAARVAFVPFFYVTAKRGDAGWMMALCALLGLTGGWLSVLGFMRAPRGFSVRPLPFFHPPSSFLSFTFHPLFPLLFILLLLLVGGCFAGPRAECHR